MVKNDHFHEGGKVGRSIVTPTKQFYINSFDLKTLSLNQVMISSLSLKCKSNPTIGPMAKSMFCCYYSVHLLTRTLPNHAQVKSKYFLSS